VTREVMGGLGCGVVTNECRTGRRILMGRISTPMRILTDRMVIHLWMTQLGLECRATIVCIHTTYSSLLWSHLAEGLIWRVIAFACSFLTTKIDSHC
jgi:hypothetical protein